MCADEKFGGSPTYLHTGRRRKNYCLGRSGWTGEREREKEIVSYFYGDLSLSQKARAESTGILSKLTTCLLVHMSFCRRHDTARSYVYLFALEIVLNGKYEPVV